MKIGCHLSAAEGFVPMAKQALEIGANTFQFFTRNPRGFKAKQIEEDDVTEFTEIIKQNNFTKLLAHAPYTLNPCSADKKVCNTAKTLFIDDLKRMEYIPGNLYNFHPGSHVGQGIETGIKMIADLLNEILKKEQSTIVLLETMSGKGSEVGSKFEELRQIIDFVELKDKIGICLDTCHVYDAGYDIVNNLDGVIKQFDDIIGLDKLKAIHLNDTKNPFSSHKDRHEKIGEGFLGIEAITRIINHPKLKNLPFLLETPNDIDGYAKEIELLKELYNE